MSAAVAAISAQHPEDAKEVAAFAAAANLLTTTVVAYFSLFLPLPMANWLYGKLEPVLSPRKQLHAYTKSNSAEVDEALDSMTKSHETPGWTVIATLVTAGAVSLAGNWIAT